MRKNHNRSCTFVVTPKEMASKIQSANDFNRQLCNISPFWTKVFALRGKLTWQASYVVEMIERLIGIATKWSHISCEYSCFDKICRAEGVSCNNKVHLLSVWAVKSIGFGCVNWVNACYSNMDKESWFLSPLARIPWKNSKPPNCNVSKNPFRFLAYSLGIGRSLVIGTLVLWDLSCQFVFGEVYK